MRWHRLLDWDRDNGPFWSSDGRVDISDPIGALGVLFLGNGIIPLPGMIECGVDPTDDALDCEHHESCL